MKNIFCYISLLCVALLSSCNTQKQSSALQDNEPAIFSNPEQPAYYINGGDKGLLNDLYTTLFKTAPVSQEDVVGRAVVSFSIGKDGIIEPNSIKVERNRSVPQEYMDAAIEAIKKLGKFEPGKMNGTPLRVTYHLPIIYPLPLDQITKSE